MRRFLCASVGIIIPLSAFAEFKRIPVTHPKHPALITIFGDPAYGQPIQASGLRWPTSGMIIQGAGDSRLDFTVWDPDTRRRVVSIKTEHSFLSEDANDLGEKFYDASTKSFRFNLYSFPSGKKLWTKPLDVSEAAFPPGEDWFVVGRGTSNSDQVDYQIDLTSGKVLKEHKWTRPFPQEKRVGGQIKCLAATSTHVFIGSEESSYDFSKPQSERYLEERLEILEVANWKIKKQPGEALSMPSKFQASPDGKYLALYKSFSSQIVTAHTLRPVYSWRGGSVWRGKQILTVHTDKSMLLWDGKKIATVGDDQP